MSRSTVRVTPIVHKDDPINVWVIDWVKPDGSVEFSFDTSNCRIDTINLLIAYGAKQVLADGGAVGRNIPDAERLAKMEKRARALMDGTWAFRDGHGTPRPEADASVMFACLVEAGVVPDDADIRTAWKAAKPTERRAMLNAAPEAKRLFDERTAPKVDGAALLARLTASA